MNMTGVLDEFILQHKQLNPSWNPPRIEPTDFQVQVSGIILSLLRYNILAACCQANNGNSNWSQNVRPRTGRSSRRLPVCNRKKTFSSFRLALSGSRSSSRALTTSKASNSRRRPRFSLLLRHLKIAWARHVMEV